VSRENKKNEVQTLPLSDLPKGWSLSTLGDVSTKPQYGWTTKANHESGNVKLLRTTDITSGQINWSTVPYCTKEPDDLTKYLLEPGDIVISRAGSVGVSYLITDIFNSVFASYLIRFRPHEQFNKKYVYYYLKSPAYWKAIGKSTLGIAIPNVNATKLAKIKIPIAPENEQSRIVSEIEKQFSRLDEAFENLKRVKANLKKYKASVLKAAVEGKLTEDWRKANPDVEPADKLLERILVERRQKWEELELAKMKAKGKVPQDDNWKKKYKGPDNPEIIDLPLLPDGWIWVNIDQIILLLTDYHANGSYKILKQNVEILGPDNYAIYVRATNLEKNNFKTNLKYVTKKAHMFLKKSEVFGNEIIIGKIGNAGKVYFMPKLDRPCTLGMNLFMLRFSQITVVRYIYYHLISFFSENEIKSKVKGVGNPSIDKKAVRSLRIALPPIEEQKELLKLVDEKISLISNLEFELIKHLSRAERLRQSILKKAFSGKLVF